MVEPSHFEKYAPVKLDQSSLLGLRIKHLWKYHLHLVGMLSVSEKTPHAISSTQISSYTTRWANPFVFPALSRVPWLPCSFSTHHCHKPCFNLFGCDLTCLSISTRPYAGANLHSFRIPVVWRMRGVITNICPERHVCRYFLYQQIGHSVSHLPKLCKK